MPFNGRHVPSVSALTSHIHTKSISDLNTKNAFSAQPLFPSLHRSVDASLAVSALPVLYGIGWAGDRRSAHPLPPELSPLVIASDVLCQLCSHIMTNGLILSYISYIYLRFTICRLICGLALDSNIFWRLLPNNTFVSSAANAIIIKVIPMRANSEPKWPKIDVRIGSTIIIFDIDNDRKYCDE